MKKTLLLAIVCCCTLIAQAQSLEFYKHNLEELASPKMRGRAYDGGDSIAAAFIADVFKQSGAVTIADCFGKNIADSSNINGYFQQVVFPTNEVVKADVYFDGVKARAGYDFIIDATSGSKKGKFEAYYSQDSILKFNETIELFKERGKEIVYIREMSIPSYMLDRKSVV